MIELRDKRATRTEVPFLDLKDQYATIRREIETALLDVAQSGTYVLGPRVTAFEEAFARHVGARYCVGLSSGTAALHLALIAAGVGPGDEVITVPMTFIATIWAISYVGAIPVFVDVDPHTYTMDVEQVEDRITPRTRALLPVHLYGQPANLGDLLNVARRHGIPLIEDAAQAHGARYQDRGAGSLGRCGCFSFYPGKNLGACGEAGAVVTDDEQITVRLRALRDHAQTERYRHTELGFNYRMGAIQGAVLGIKLKYLDAWTERRRRLAGRYFESLHDQSLVLPSTAPDRSHAWHLFVVLHRERDRLRRNLEEHGVHTGLHYPAPVHLQPAYRHLGHHVGDFPVAERVARHCLSLPLYPEMTLDQQDHVIETLQEIIKEREWA